MCYLAMGLMHEVVVAEGDSPDPVKLLNRLFGIFTRIINMGI